MKLLYKKKIILFFLVFLINQKSAFSQEIFVKGSASDPILILPLGNSITFDSRTNDTRSIGEKDGYRGPLYNLLKNAGYVFDFVGTEHSGGNYLPAGFDEHGGFPGITDDQMLYLLQTGHLLQPGQGVDRQVTVGPYLNSIKPDIILLHIGTNGNDDESGIVATEVEQILNEIDNYENEFGKDVIVLLARIIDRVPNQSYVELFNNNVEMMALDRVNNLMNSAYPDKIVFIDLQDSANLNYTISPEPEMNNGDMNDALHPNNNGFDKIALQWFNSLAKILPNPPQIVSHPVDQYSIEGNSAAFSVVVNSKEPLTYQWKKNGVNVSLTNKATFTLQNIKSSDNGTEFSCQINNVNGSVVSQSAKLYVTNLTERVKNGIIAEYDFEEGEGTVIHNKTNNNSNLDLNIITPNSVNWINNGINIWSSARISTNNAATNIIDTIYTQNEFSLEVWMRTENGIQSGPARIVTISKNSDERNFTLGQKGNNFAFRTRTTNTDLNGLPELDSFEDIITEKIIQVFITHDSLGVERIYINGVLDSTYQKGGNLSNWNNSFKLALGNELVTDQPWFGNLYHLAFYKRKLNDDEILHNYNLAADETTYIYENNFTVPDNYILYQNYPNPFNPSTSISFSLPENSKVILSIYNLLGQKLLEIDNKNYSTGNHSIDFDGSKLTSGVYLYTIQAIGASGKNYQNTKKMILLK